MPLVQIARARGRAPRHGSGAGESIVELRATGTR